MLCWSFQSLLPGHVLLGQPSGLHVRCSLSHSVWCCSSLTTWGAFVSFVTDHPRDMQINNLQSGHASDVFYSPYQRHWRMTCGLKCFGQSNAYRDLAGGWGLNSPPPHPPPHLILFQLLSKTENNEPKFDGETSVGHMWTDYRVPSTNEHKW